MANKMTTFDKYETAGAYHWRECDPGSSVFNPPLVARYRLILTRVKAGRALDVGAGDGYLTARLAERCESVAALEYEPAGVAAAKTMLAGLPNVSIQHGSTYELPFENDSFDVITMADVIEHLESPEVAIAEIARVAAPMSIAYITTPQWRPDRIWDPRHVKEYTPDEFQALVGRGFKTVEMVYAWPRRWSDLYRTRVGWRVLRFAGRHGFNPFAIESATPEGFCQMMAIGRDPR